VQRVRHENCRLDPHAAIQKFLGISGTSKGRCRSEIFGSFLGWERGVVGRERGSKNFWGIFGIQGQVGREKCFGGLVKDEDDSM
jgi:hypothetical protein